MTVSTINAKIAANEHCLDHILFNKSFIEEYMIIKRTVFDNRLNEIILMCRLISDNLEEQQQSLLLLFL